MLACVTVNVTAGLTLGVAALSVPVTEWVPTLDAGMENVLALNEPTEDVVIVAGDVVCAVPSNFIVIVLLAAKPVPVTVTVVPTGPLVGLIDIDGVTVNVVV